MPLKKHTSKKDPKQLSKKELFGPAHFTLPMIQCKSYPSFLPTKKTQENTWKPSKNEANFCLRRFPPTLPRFCWLCVCRQSPKYVSGWYRSLSREGRSPSLKQQTPFKIGRLPQKERILFQPSVLRCSTHC